MPMFVTSWRTRTSGPRACDQFIGAAPAKAGAVRVTGSGICPDPAAGRSSSASTAPTPSPNRGPAPSRPVARSRASSIRHGRAIVVRTHHRWADALYRHIATSGAAGFRQEHLGSSRRCRTCCISIGGRDDPCWLRGPPKASGCGDDGVSSTPIPDPGRRRHPAPPDARWIDICEGFHEARPPQRNGVVAPRRRRKRAQRMRAGPRRDVLRPRWRAYRRSPRGNARSHASLSSAGPRRHRPRDPSAHVAVPDFRHCWVVTLCDGSQTADDGPPCAHAGASPACTERWLRRRGHAADGAVGGDAERGRRPCAIDRARAARARRVSSAAG